MSLLTTRLHWQLLGLSRALNQLGRGEYLALLLCLPLALAGVAYFVQFSSDGDALQKQLALLSSQRGPADPPTTPAFDPSPLATASQTAAVLAALAQGNAQLTGQELLESPPSPQPGVARRVYLLSYRARYADLLAMLAQPTATRPGLAWRGLDFQVQDHPNGQLRLTLELLTREEPRHASSAP